MSMVYNGDGNLVLVDNAPSGVSCSVSADRLSLVLELLSSGYLGGGTFFGNQKHIDALAKVEARIACVRKLIAEQTLSKLDVPKTVSN